MKASLWIIVFLLMVAAPANALERFEIITTEQLQQLIEDRASGKIDFVLVNTLDRLIFEHHTIPGSVNLPWSLVQENGDVLGPDKGRKIITY